MPFALDSSPSNIELSDAINYLLANFGANLSADPNTGVITGPTGQTIAYLYRYLSVKYADSADGALNFANTPTNRLYYGLRNNDSSTESTNPADYLWLRVSGGFGTTKFLFYQTTGGRQIDIIIDTTNPTENYVEDDGTAIDLDLLTAGKGRQVAYPTIYKWTSTNTPPTRPSVTTVFTWETGEYLAPAGWGVTPPLATSTDKYLWGITVPLSASINDETSICDWTNVDYAIYKIAENGTNGLSFINAYLSQNQSLPAPSFSATTAGATIPAGWSATPPAVSVGEVLWYIQGQYNSSDITIDGVAPNTTEWTGPIAASVFQDIRSDNWNGDNPPTFATPSTWGTAGYYISRTTGTAILNNLGARGTLQSGSSPAISGTTMTGSGGVINSNGTFALGNSTTNITFNGTQVTLNGDVVNTRNINLNAVTVPSSAYSLGPIGLSTSFLTVQSIFIDRSFGIPLASPMVGIISYTHQNTGLVNQPHTVEVRVFRSADSVEVFWAAFSALGAWTTPYAASFLDYYKGSTNYNMQVRILAGTANAFYTALTLLEAKR
jgi:hypothetical protein